MLITQETNFLRSRRACPSIPNDIFTGKIVLIVLLFLEEMSTGFNILKKIKAAPTDPSLKSDWSFQASSNPNLTVILTPCSPGR